MLIIDLLRLVPEPLLLLDVPLRLLPRDAAVPGARRVHRVELRTVMDDAHHGSSGSANGTRGSMRGTRPTPTRIHLTLRDLPTATAIRSEQPSH